MLLLNQASGERVFEALRGKPSCGDWSIHAAGDEPESLVAESDDQWIAVVCGRQVRCQKGLEVAALGTLDEFPDGESVAEMIRRVRESGALACLPWGFGKWSGARGALIAQALEEYERDAFVVCDNGGRLEAFGQPRLIGEAARRGFTVLPGTDPFPIGNDYRRTGAFGFLGPEPSRLHPWRDLLQWLKSHEGSPSSYGKALGPARFVFNNIGIQLYNRRKRKDE